MRRFDALARLVMIDSDNKQAAKEMDHERGRFEKIARRGPAVALSAPLLFPTPKHIAEQMVNMADIKTGHSILEPSGGTGRILDALPTLENITVVEISTSLQLHLYANYSSVKLIGGDFMAFEPGQLFDRVLMNPPYKRGLDIKHIKRALGFLAIGGVLVALCYDGKKQREHLLPLADYWEKLPPKSFEGTSTDVLLLVIKN